MNREVWTVMGKVERAAYLKGIKDNIYDIIDYISECESCEETPETTINMVKGYLDGIQKGIQNEIIRN